MKLSLLPNRSILKPTAGSNSGAPAEGATAKSVVIESDAVIFWTGVEWIRA